MDIFGTNSGETLTGTLGDDIISALAGNDIINGSQGNDSVDGGAGVDRLVFTLANAALFDAAVSARSFIVGSNYVGDSTTINTVFSNVENITFSTFGAGNFADTIDASGFNGTSVTILLGDGNASVTGSSKADTITTGRGHNVVSAGGGTDSINASQGHDIIDGGASGATGDLLTFNMAVAARFDAAIGARTYSFTATHVGDSSGTVNTDFTSVERFSLITSGCGDFNDTIDASGILSTSTTTVFSLTAGNGNNTVVGSNYADFLNMGRGQNMVDAGGGIDEVRLHYDNNVAATFFITGSGGTIQTSFNGLTNTVLNAESVMIQPDFFGTSGVTVDASGLSGFAGQLILLNTTGDDVFIGHNGVDVFGTNFQSVGTDTYRGNGGADIYDYTFSVGVMDADTILDFDNDDIIDLQFNNSVNNGAGLRADHFIGSAAFSGTVGEYRTQIVGNTTLVQADTNGDGVADQTLTIANGSFILEETFVGSNQLHLAATVITGTGAGNTLTGTTGNDFIYGLGGSDNIVATRGADNIDGGTGNDRLTVTMGNLTLFAAYAGDRSYVITNSSASDGTGMLASSLISIERLTFSTLGTGDHNDSVDLSGFSSAASNPVTVTTGDGNDTLIGTGVNDLILAGRGSNWVDAGGGFDEVRVNYDNSIAGTFYATGSGGTIQTSFNGQTNTILNAEAVMLWGNAAVAGATIDASGVTAFGGQIAFTSTQGSDVFIGHDGADFFATNYQATVGSDTYRGNGGADIYDYTFAVSAMDDTILDFDNDDIIDLQFNTIASNGGGFRADHFIGNAEFSGTVGEYRTTTVGNTTLVQADTNGDGIADQTLTIVNGAFVLEETVAGSNQLHLAGLVVTGTGANDPSLTGSLGNDRVFGLGGNDLINGTLGHDVVDGGTGTDRLVFLLFDPAKVGAITGPSTYTVTANHVGNSSGSIDTSFTSIERINIFTRGSGDFSDTIDVSGFVTMPGLLGVATITAGGGNDTIVGTNYGDEIYGGLGSNVINAGGGADSVYVQSDFSTGGTLFVSGSGNQVNTAINGVTNAISNAELVTVGADTKFNLLTVDGFTNRVDASAYTGTAQLIFADHNGNDIFIGSSRADTFHNVYNSTVGNDTYTGGGGADIYDYTFAVGSMNGDRITDFGFDDLIDLSYNNPAQNGGGLLANNYIGFAYFTGHAGEVRYQLSGGNTYLQVDTNGDMVADQTLTINGSFFLKETAPGSNILQAILPTVGTASADTLNGTAGWDALIGLDGNDTFNATAGRDFVIGGSGVDRLVVTMGGGAFAAATGSRSYFILSNTVADVAYNVFTAFDSVERVTLSTVGTGDFGDSINASYFVSTAGGTVVTIRAGDGNDSIVGSGYDDSIFTGLGNNVVDAGAGYDRAWVTLNDANPATIYITSVGNALVTTQGGIQTNNLTNVEEVQVYGQGIGTTVTLDASGYSAIPGMALYLVGHNGTDIMVGSSGSDFFANAPGQVLGNDAYTGNGGADIYDYTFAADSMNGDRITDFDIDDVIDLRFNTVGASPNPTLATHFLGAAAFTNTAGEYRYQISGTQTLVQLDSNGDGIADQVLTIANGAFALAETAAGSNILTLASVIDSVSGVVADGYIQGATLFVDTNGNKLLDPGEAWTVTGPGGSFSLNVNQGGTIVAIGGVNADTLLANTMVLSAPIDAGVINPLTTLVEAVFERGGGSITIATAQARVLAALGLNPSLDLLTYDLLAHGNDPSALAAQKAAAMVSNLVSAAEGAAGATGATEGALVGALAALISTTPAGSTINLASAATLTPLLTTALPGVSNVGALAGEVAFESETIANATSIGAIGSAQVDAHIIDYSLDNIFTGTAADNHLSGLGGNDTLNGLAGNDWLEGGTGNDFLYGGVGNDRLDGGSGSDLLDGGSGNDTLNGGDGTDYLRAGAGNDVFVAGLNSNLVASKTGPISLDVILDFSAGDRIDLSGMDANLGLAGRQAFIFQGTGSGKGVGDLTYKVYDSVNGAEKALGMEIDGVAGASPYSGPVTMVFGNHDGGAPDFALALIGVQGIDHNAFIFG